MSSAHLPLSVGRAAFGDDPVAYEAARPAYPDGLFRTLGEACGDLLGADLVEIGPGTGLATVKLLSLRPARLLAIEPDTRLADHLEATLGAGDPALSVLRSSFEDAVLPPDGADLVLSATAFHWLEQDPALRKVMAVLRPGGWIAPCWHVFADRDDPDALERESAPLWRALPPSRSHPGNGGMPFALDQAGRLADLRRAGFKQEQVFIWRWAMRMDTQQVLALASTFSQVSRAKPEIREAFLRTLAELMRTRFDGSTERRFTTILYLGRKPGGRT